MDNFNTWRTSSGFAPLPEGMTTPRDMMRELGGREKRIRELAYYKWLDSGCASDKDLDFWLQAEAEYVAAEKLVHGM